MEKGKPGNRLMQIEKLPNFSQRESEALTPANEIHGFEIRLTVGPIAGKRTCRFAKQAAPLIKTQSLDIQARLARQFTNKHSFGIIALRTSYGKPVTSHVRYFCDHLD